MTKSDKTSSPVKVESAAVIQKPTHSILIGRVFNGTIQVMGASYSSEEDAKKALQGRKADGVFVLLSVLEL